jgi:hypothetical protein
MMKRRPALIAPASWAADSLKAHWRMSKRRVPGNIARDMGTAASEGWLERLDAKGQYSVTSYGESHFDGLPKSDE